MNNKNQLLIYLSDNWQLSLGLLTLFSVLSTGIYYLGFLNQLGIPLSSIEFTPSDFLVGIVLWAPKVCIILFVIFFIDVVTVRTSKSSKFDNVLEHEKDKELLKRTKVLQRIYLIFVILSIIMIIISIYIKVLLLISIPIAFLCLNFLLFYILIDVRVLTKYGLPFITAITLTFYLSTSIYFIARADARIAQLQNIKAKVHVSNAISTEGTILFSTSKSTIVKEKQRYVICNNPSYSIIPINE